MSNLNKPFMYVNDEDVESFLTYQNAYNNKIAFLGSTGKLATQGNVYGIDPEIYIGDPSSAPEEAKIIIDNTTDTSVEVYSKSQVDEKFTDVNLVLDYLLDGNLADLNSGINEILG